MNLLHDLVGYAAATLTTLAFIPQTLKSLQTRDMSGVSLGMYSLFTLGVGFWLIYGVMLESWPIIIANSITLGLAGTVLFLKLRHQQSRESSVTGSSRIKALSQDR